MSISKASLVPVLQALAEELRALELIAQAPRITEFREDDLRPHFDALRAQFDRLSELLPDARTTDFASFLRSVGESFIRAQQNLDAQSERYLRDTAHQPHLLPSVFRIPKLTAEIKFALEKLSGKELNLLFYQRKDEASSLHQQSLSFEIVSAPLPPEMQRQLTHAIPLLDLLLEPAARAAVFEALQSLAPEPAAWLSPNLLLEHRDEVLICRQTASLAEPTGDSYFLLYADATELKNIGVWHLDGPNRRLTAVYRYDLAPGKHEDLAPLKDFTLALARLQKEFLRRLQ
jgi:hypothetical protein